MEKICVYTCITGNYDNLKDVIVKEKGVDYVCFTNNREITSSTWKIIYIDDGILNNIISKGKISHIRPSIRTINRKKSKCSYFNII